MIVDVKDENGEKEPRVFYTNVKEWAQDLKNGIELMKTSLASLTDTLEALEETITWTDVVLARKKK